MSTNAIIQALEKNGSLTSLEERQPSELNDYFVTLHAILRINSSSDIDGNFIYSGGVSSTGGFNIMMEKITDMGLPSRLPYPQSDILSNRQSLSAAEYAHRNEKRFINGVETQMDKGATVRDNNQTDDMSKLGRKIEKTIIYL